MSPGCTGVTQMSPRCTGVTPRPGQWWRVCFVPGYPSGVSLTERCGGRSICSMAYSYSSPHHGCHLRHSHLGFGLLLESRWIPKFFSTRGLGRILVRLRIHDHGMFIESFVLKISFWKFRFENFVLNISFWKFCVLKISFWKFLYSFTQALYQ